MLDALLEAIRMGGAQMGPAAMAAPAPAPLMSGAEPSDVWGGPAPLPAGMLRKMMESGAEPNAAWAGPGSGGISPPAQRGLAKDTTNPIMGMLASLMQRPGSPSPLGETNEAPADGGLIRKGSFFDSILGGSGAQASPGVNSSGAEPSEAWSMPPPTNDPLSGEPKPDVPLPRPRPADLGGRDAADPGPPLSLAPQDYQRPDALPVNAKPVEGRVAPDEPGFLETIGKKIFDPNKAATWMALGSGFAGAGSVGTGMRRAFGNAVPAMAADRAQIMKQSTIADTYRALVQKGVPPAEALAASQNPDIMKAVASKYFEAKPRVPHNIGVDMMGNPVVGSFDPNTGKFYDAAGNLIQGKGGAPGGIDLGAGMLAKGVTELNQELPADEFKAQFSPQVQAQIDNYINGDTMPTGNPRVKGSATKIKEWATLYGSKAGIPVSDSEFSRKRTMQNQIASSSPSSMGGILSNGKSAFGHLASLGENFVQQRQRSGPDVPGGAHVGRLANYVGNEIAPTPEARGNLAAVRDNAAKYGAEATKFYAATGGGVEERLSALKEVGQPGTLAAEQAAYMKTEKDLMLKRIAEKESQIRDVMGDTWLAKHPVRTKELQHDLDRIESSIKRLEGGPAAKSAAPAVRAAAPAPGNYVYDPASKRLVPAQ